MAAAPVGQPRNRKFVELKAPEMFKFTKPSQLVEGVLVRIEPTVVNQEGGHQSETLEYMVQMPNGDRLTFLGTNDLNKKIRAEYIGHWHRIRYERDDSSFVKPGQSAAKVFKVDVDPEKEPGY